MRAGNTVGLIFACAVALPAAAQERNAQPGARAIAPTIAVTAVRNPVDKSYVKMIRGMELFEQMRAMAPNATLRYKLLPRKPDSNLDGIQLSVSGNTFEMPVDLAPDRTFTLVRDQKALAEDASVRTDRRALTMTWRAEIRTPGLPPDTRRLGDLRLECHVGMEADLVSNVRSRSLFFTPASNARLRAEGYCDQPNARYLYFAERPLLGVTLVSGARRQALPIDNLYAGVSRNELRREELPFCDCEVLLDRAYYLPLGDRSWPDDTLVEFQYTDTQPSVVTAFLQGRS